MEIMIMSKKTELKTQCDIAFRNPYVSHRWNSNRSQNFWVDLEGWQMAILGPVTSINEHGGCAYVYTRGDKCFEGIVDVASLRLKFLYWLGKITEAVEEFLPDSPGEISDKASMKLFVERIKTAIEIACEIEQARWDGMILHE